MNTSTSNWQKWLETAHLDIELDLPQSVDEMSLPEVYVAIEIDLLSHKDDLVTHWNHTSACGYADDLVRQIENQVSPSTLSRWLYHGCEQVVQMAGATVCDLSEPNGDLMWLENGEQGPGTGYHKIGACLDDYEHGCVVFELFSGLGNRPEKLLRRPMSFSSIRPKDGRQSFTPSDHTVLGNVRGTWKVTLRELKPEFIGLLCEAVSFLDMEREEFEFQLGGRRNISADLTEVRLINPLYSKGEIRRALNRAMASTETMEEKDDLWRSKCRPEFVRALQARTAARDGDLPVPANTVEGEVSVANTDDDEVTEGTIRGE